MGKAKVAVVAAGITSIAIGIIAAYTIYQESAEREYIAAVNNILSERNKIINEFMSDLLPRLETKQVSVSEGESIVSSRVNDASKLHQQASSINVPDKYKSGHPPLVQSLDYFTKSIESTRNALQYTQKALEASEQLQISSAIVIRAIFASGSLPDSSEISALRSATESARAAFNEAVGYLQQSEVELEAFVSDPALKDNVSFSDRDSERIASIPPTEQQLKECRELGIPEFSCSEEQILEKKRLLNAGK